MLISKKSKNYSNLLKLQKYKKREGLLKFSKGLYSDLRLGNYIRFNLYSNKLVYLSVRRFIKNSCLITGRQSGLVRYFRMNRMNFRELASFGDLPGIRKSSW